MFTATASIVAAACEEARDGDQEDRADRGGGEAAPKAPNDDAELQEDPAADDGADQTEDDIYDAAETAAARNVAGNPSSEQSNDDGGDKSGRSDFDVNRVHLVLRLKDAERELNHAMALRELSLAEDIAKALVNQFCGQKIRGMVAGLRQKLDHVEADDFFVVRDGAHERSHHIPVKAAGLGRAGGGDE